MSQTVTDQDFDQQVLKNTKVVLVDFWAEWCGPCRMQNPILEEVEKELGETAIISKLNVDENSQTAQTYGVMSIPSLLVFKSGQLVKQFVGVQSKETLVSELKKYQS